MSALEDLRPKGSGNATVPVDAPIQPPQAFVDAMIQFSLNTTHSAMVLSNSGITGLRFVNTATDNCFGSFVDRTYGMLGKYQVRDADDDPDIYLDGNALDVQSVNDVLHWYATSTSNSFSGDAVIDLSGPDMADPTGQGLTDMASLVGAGWTVYTHSNPP